METIRVRAKGSAMVPDLEAHEAGARRYIGRRHDPNIGHDVTDEHGRVVGKSGGWPPLDEPVEVPARAEYLAAIRDGDLELVTE